MKLPKPPWLLREHIPPLELAWAAGLFEGEGTVRINPPANRNYGHVEVSVTNTDMDILGFFQDRWPASKLAKVSVRPEQRDAYRWGIQARRALVFLDAIEPFVVNERMKRRIHTARDFQKLKSTPKGQRTADYGEQGFNLWLWMAHLNVRGRVPERVAV